MHRTVVTPPRAAARLPVIRSSFHGNPGSRKWTCVSTSPGVTTHPDASMTVISSLHFPDKAASFHSVHSDRFFPVLTILSSRISTSCTRSVPAAGSIVRPFLINIIFSGLHSWRQISFFSVANRCRTPLRKLPLLKYSIFLSHRSCNVFFCFRHKRNAAVPEAPGQLPRLTVRYYL